MEKMLGSGDNDGGTSQRVLGTFLTWLQEKKKPVFVIATANSIKGLPPELLRRGRLDEMFFIDLPTLDEREEIVKIHLGKVVDDGQCAMLRRDSRHLAEMTSGFSGAEIEQVVIDAMYQAFAEDERLPVTQDLIDSIVTTVPLSKVRAAEVGALRDWARQNCRPASGDEITLVKVVDDEAKGLSRFKKREEMN